MWKRLKFYAVMTTIVSLALVALYYRLQLQQGGSIARTLDASAVVRQIQQLNELVTVRYTIQKAIGLKEQKVPFGSESVMMLVQAHVLGGIDLTGLSSNDVQFGPHRAIRLQLPAPRVLHVFLDDKQTQVWDRSKTIFVDLNPQLEQNARQAALESVQQAALSMGILSNAQQNAENALRGFLQSLGFESVSFQPQPAP